MIPLTRHNTRENNFLKMQTQISIKLSSALLINKCSRYSKFKISLWSNTYDKLLHAVRNVRNENKWNIIFTFSFLFDEQLHFNSTVVSDHYISIVGSNGSRIQEFLCTTCLQYFLAKCLAWRTSRLWDVEKAWEPVHQFRGRTHNHIERFIPWRPCHICISPACTIHNYLCTLLSVSDRQGPNLYLQSL